MGKFARQVRLGQIAGPNRPDFDRAKWESLASSFGELDSDDRRIMSAGLIFDELLSDIRARKRISELTLSPARLARAAVAVANFFHRAIESLTSSPSSENGEVIALSDIQQIYVATGGAGDGFQPDELFTGIGDGLRYLLADILDKPAHAPSSEAQDWLTGEDLETVVEELKRATQYHVLVDYWHDCVANDYEIAPAGDALLMVPKKPELEIARIASTYRRLSLSLQDSVGFIRWWKYELRRTQKESLHGIRLVTGITVAAGAVEYVRIGRSFRAVERQSSSVEALLQLKMGPYAFVLDENLPKYGVSLIQLAKGWQFIQSLAAELHSRRGELKWNPESILSLTPVVRGRVLLSALANALSIDRQLASQLLQSLTYSGSRVQDLWAQPLVASDRDFLIVMPCIHAVHFVRILETWMRQGGLRLDERGPEFERYCRNELRLCLERSPIGRNVSVSLRSVRFADPDGKEEEIDLVIVLCDVVLIVELKCILWPDEAAHFANYRTAVEKAAKQIERKRVAVIENWSAFADALETCGCSAPAKGDVIACVLTNSAVYAGFKIHDVPVIDLDILRVFLAGKHIDWQVWNRDTMVEERAAPLYETAQEAASKIGRFIADPPQLRRIKASIEPRTVKQPLVATRFSTLSISTFRVRIDASAHLEGRNPTK